MRTKLISFFCVLALAVVSHPCLDAKVIGKSKGYSGDVSLGGTIGLSTDFGTRFTLLTTHGYCNGNGSFIGLGTGVMADFSDNFTIPVYAKWTYTFNTDNDLRPYVGSSLGFCVNDRTDASVYVSPEVGVRLGRFFFNVQYSFYDYLGGISNLGNNISVANVYCYHAMSFGVGVSF
ncbi:MAG: hypothetical protein K2O58_05390 [Bacteroidales bacterium]|nr:hypothetical protein [Bacteroidales bacterium]